MRTSPFFAAHVPSVLALAACGGTFYSPGARAHFDPANTAREINEDDIRAAFDAHPQMPNHVRVAYYTFEPSRAEAIEVSLRTLPRVEGTYAIPSLLVTGHRRFDQDRPWEPTRELGLHALRLLAARAHCDLLVVYDYGWRVERTVNGWAALNVLILPALFTPFVDTHVQSYLDAYVIDVRNGYLYHQSTSSREDRRRNLTAWDSPESQIEDAQWSDLLSQTSSALTATLEGRAGGSFARR